MRLMYAVASGFEGLCLDIGETSERPFWSKYDESFEQFTFTNICHKSLNFEGMISYSNFLYVYIYKIKFSWLLKNFWSYRTQPGIYQHRAYDFLLADLNFKSLLLHLPGSMSVNAIDDETSLPRRQ